MKRAGNFILKQSAYVLESKQHAVMYAVLLSILPFATWLSVVLVALVTLRKGAKIGFEVMIPALVVHSVPLMMMVPLDSALINTLIAYIPCYLAACALRQTQSWQVVFAVFFIQAVFAAVLVQTLVPDFVLDQFNQFKSILTQYQEYQQFIDTNSANPNLFNWAQLFFSIQILSVVITATISLLFARSLQSKLFLPGGFSAEISAFKSGKLALIGLLTVSLASYYEIAVALNVLPMILSYFLISGFNLAYYILARKRQFRVAIFLVLLVLFKPIFVLFAYIIIGSLDSIFNFRLYLPARVREST